MKGKRSLLMVGLLVAVLAVKAQYQYTAVPRFVEGVDKPTLSLNGIWLFDTLFEARDAAAGADISGWKEIRVPGEWVMQGFHVSPGQAAVYVREVVLPSSWKGRPVMLRCDAVFSRATLWVNGHEAGSHLGGMTPFEVEVTPYLKWGQPNRLVMSVTAETVADTLMSGSQYAAHSLGGILRKIYLYVVPPVYVQGLRITPLLNVDNRSGTLQVSMQLTRAPKAPRDAGVSFRLIGPGGKEVALPTYDGHVRFGSREESRELRYELPLKEVLSWDPEHPRLYHLTVAVRSGREEERLERRIGFRRIEVVGNKLFINGRSVKMHGVNRHETHPTLGRSLNDTLWHMDAEIFKEGNVNYIRTSHYPPAEEFVAWCDSLGLLVELENPFCWVGHGANATWKKEDPQNPSFYGFLEKTSAEVIGFYYDHPSVILWSMANESTWGPNWEKLLHFYLRTDPTRPVSFHDQAYGRYNNYGSRDVPVAVFHYPGPGGGRVADTFPRPLLFGEYCHINCYNRQEIAADPGVRDAWGRGFLPMWNSVYESTGGLGGAIWAGIDDVFYLPSGKAVGYGEWGVIDGWRRKKPEYYHMKKTYTPVRIITRQVPLPAQNEPLRLEVENRFDFTDLSECRFLWEVQGHQGEAFLHLPPHQAGILRIDPGVLLHEGDLMTLTVISPQGHEVEKEVITIGKRKKAEEETVVTATQDDLKVDSTETFYLIREGDLVWKIDRGSGLILAAGTEGRPLLTGGPQLMMLPLKTGPCVTDYKLDIPPLNNLCHDRRADSIVLHQKNDTVVIAMKIRWFEAYGKMEYLITPGGKMTVRYDLVSDIKINPRQWGMVFTTGRKMEHLKWERRGLWTLYPEDHIGRTEGEAVPFLQGSYRPPVFGKNPGHPWKDDANELGSNDFRSSRENIYYASLTDGQGYGVKVLGGGHQTFRAWVDGDHISFLVAGFSTGGGDLFFSSHYRSERRPLQRGSAFSGTATVVLLP